MQKSQEKQTAKKNHSLAYKNSTSESDLLVIERKFNVPVYQLFEAFATPEALKQWWWPKDLYSDHIELEFREGGQYFFNLKGHDQGGGGMTGQFLEIITNERLVMTDNFADQKGRAISAQEAKIPGAWPKLVYITFDFESVDENKSRFTLSQEGIPNDLQEDCIQGWSTSFDKLEEYLKARKN